MRLLKDLTKQDLEGKKVLVRVDFNVAVKDNEIADDLKIRSHQKTIDYLLDNGARVVCISHISKKETALESYRLIADQISRVLGREIFFSSHIMGPEIMRALNEHKLVLLEDLRSDPREEKNDDGFARELAQGFDFYVDDAFANAHRNHASMVAVTRYLPSYAGFMLEQETKPLQDFLDAPAQGKVVVIGGAKIYTKLPVIKNFADKAEWVLIGGAIANNFYKYYGLEIGKSLCDAEYLDQIKDIPRANVFVPEYLVVATDPSGTSAVREAPEKDVLPEEYILDIAPRTARHYADLIARASMVIWNGPMGKYEVPAFSSGTKIVAEAVAANPHSVIGGGDTIAAANTLVPGAKFGYVSTGGGAMLEFLAGNRLPALEALGYYE